MSIEDIPIKIHMAHWIPVRPFTWHFIAKLPNWTITNWPIAIINTIAINAELSKNLENIFISSFIILAQIKLNT